MFNLNPTLIRRQLIILVCALAVFGLLTYYSDSRRLLAEKTLDLLFHLRGPIQPGYDITVVAIDENTIQALGSWPFSRLYHAKLLEELALAEVRAVGFDILFSESSSNDDRFSEALENGPPVILAAAHTADNHFLIPPATIHGHQGIGHIQVVLGHGGIVRRVVLKDRNGILSLAKAMVEVTDPLGIPTGMPNTPLINFYGPRQTFTTLSYLDVVDGRVPADLLKGRYILVGFEATGTGDRCFAPFCDGNLLTGVEIQATILQNLLNASFLVPLDWLVWGSLGGIILIQLVFWPILSEIKILCLNLSLVLVFFLTAIHLFEHNYFFNFALVLVFLGVAWTSHLIVQGIWLTGTITRQITSLDQKLANDLYRSFAHSRQFFQSPRETVSSSLLQHVNRLEQCVAALTLQHNFINQLLKKDMPPLVLWNQQNGKPILYSESFVDFWERYGKEETGSLPALNVFREFLRLNRLEGIPGQEDGQDGKMQEQDATLDIVLSAQRESRYYQVTLRSVEGTGREGFKGVLSIFSDVTKVRKLERLKNDTVSFVSHELRRPLTTIRGYAEMLVDGLDSRHRLYAETISSQTMRLNRLITAFLDITRLQQGERQIRRHPINLAVLINDAVANLQEPAREKNITIRTTVSESVPSPFEGDETLLLQALINLIENSIKFSHPNEEILLTLEEAADHFLIIIEDHGPGIPGEIRPFIFNAFFRGEQCRSSHGFGLGLALVDQVIRVHGGSISLGDSEQGCRFHIHLPKK